jgi:peptidyl-tRNA hydrolase
VAYFYCNRNEEQRRDPENVLRSFIRQLSTSPETDAIHDSLIQLYKEQHKTQRQRYSSTKMPLRDRETLVQQLINTYSHTILVIDALDECYEKTRIQFIAVLDELVRKSSRLKILISSRKNEDIKYQLEKKLNVGISATDNQNDISKFVATAIKEDERTRRNAIPSELKGKIVQTLLDKSDGMYVQIWLFLPVSAKITTQVPMGVAANQSTIDA